MLLSSTLHRIGPRYGQHANAGGPWSPSHKDMRLPLTRLTSPPNVENMTFAPGHGLQYECDAANIDRTGVDLAGDARSISESNSPARDGKAATKDLLLVENRGDEAGVGIAGWNVAVSAAKATRRGPTLGNVPAEDARLCPSSVTMPPPILGRWAGWIAMIAIAALPLSSCANADTPHAAPIREEAMKPGVGAMLEEIYASGKPIRFERLDVSPIVKKYFPVGTDRASVVDAFAKSSTSKIIEDHADKVVVRDNRGQAMLDPDARSVVMSFQFDADGKVAGIEALHLKNQ